MPWFMYSSIYFKTIIRTFLGGPVDKTHTSTAGAVLIPVRELSFYMLCGAAKQNKIKCHDHNIK